MNKVLLTFLVLFPKIVLGVTLDEIFNDAYGAWELPSDQEIKRWVVIHNLETAKVDGVFHIEVLGRKKGDRFGK